MVKKTKKFLPKGKITLDDLFTTNSVKELIAEIKEHSGNMTHYVLCYDYKDEDGDNNFKYMFNGSPAETISLLDIIKTMALDDILGKDEE